MAGYELVLEQGKSRATRFQVSEEGLLVGRTNACDVVLPDSMVSRQHARVWLEDDSIHVEDLGSMNGVLVNGRRVWRACLLDGDEVVIGSKTLLLRRTSAGLPNEQTGSSISFQDADSLVEGMLQTAGTRRLLVLYQAAQLLGSVFDLDELLKQTLALVVDALKVHRGFILTRPDDQKEPDVRATLSDDDTSTGPPVSSCIIDHVFCHKNAILTLNAQEDPRFANADSVVEHGIHAAMCAPLQGRSSFVGVIYVDAGTESAFFSDDELELLTAIGRIVGVAVENAQLHQEKVASERLAAIGQATAGVGHCVKNVLAGAKGGGEFMDMGIDDENWQHVKKGRALLRRSVDRIEDLVLNLLTFSRDHPMEFTKSDLNSLVDEVLSVVRSRADKANVTLEFGKGRMTPAYVDSREMYRVLLNLITNAIDACERTGGKVSISTQQDESGCYIEVRDTGIGIPYTIRDKMFQAFVSSKGSRGTGLGLACSQKIVHAHQGEITFDSTLGKGSTFTVFLPMGSAHPTQPTQAPHES